MKTRLVLFLAFVVIIFSSCDLTGESNYQPGIYFMGNSFVKGGDTLSFYGTNESNVYRLDTITVGDTVVFVLNLEAYANNLVSYSMVQSADSVSRIILPEKVSMDSIFLSSSNYQRGIFYFKEKVFTSLYFPFRYVATKASNEAKITFSVSSDANFEYNQSSMVLKTPIKSKPVTTSSK